MTLCKPGSASECVVIDHVFLDTGSIGLRLFRSAVASLSLPALEQYHLYAVQPQQAPQDDRP